MAEFQVNSWISFLRQYGPIPRNDNMYDESIQRAIRKRGLRPLKLSVGPTAEILQNFRSNRPSSIVLTGTAGDGKTYLCREVWTALGGTIEDWEADVKIRQLSLGGGVTLTVVKDLSELQGDDYSHLARMADCVVSPTSNEVFLIAANDGQLIEAWTRAPRTSNVESVEKNIEDLVVTGQPSNPELRLRLYYLSRTNTADLLAKIVDEVQGHEGWKSCDGCRGQLPGQENRCPIWENHERLGNPLFRARLESLLQLCDRNGYHLPIRQLLLLVSNTILGHSEAKDGLLQCRDIPGIVAEGKTGQASIYDNVFGGNLTESRAGSTEVIEVLRRFGVGDETSNRIDNLLVFGGEEPRLAPIFNALVRADTVYGAHDRFLRLQADYIEGASATMGEEFLSALPAQRRRLFFVITPEAAQELKLWDLTVFQFAGEYLDEVVRPLASGEKAPRPVLARLVKGLNRVFTGLLTTTDRELVLASSGSYSQARISRIEEYRVSVDPVRGQKIVLEYKEPGVDLAVYLEQTRKIVLPLHVLRYEFLSRVAEGALPSSFSRECYEDILSFKSKLLRGLVAMRAQYGEEASALDEMDLKLLELDPRGMISSRPLSVKLTERRKP